MKLHRLLIPAALAVLAGCDSIGEGSTVESLSLVHAPVVFVDQSAMIDDTDGKRLRMYDCFCSTVTVLGRFSEGGFANFNFRAKFTSSDPSVVRVTTYPETDTDACPFLQQGPGMLIPVGEGVATIKAEFVGLTTTLKVEVKDTTDFGGETIELAPSDPDNSPIVAVGASLPLTLTGVIDNRGRQLNANVLTWDFTNPDEEVATIAGGTVRGWGRSGDTPRIARARFGTCTDIAPELPIAVGDIVEPLLIAEEENFTTDDKLAVDTTETLVVTARLSTDDDQATIEGQQIVSTQSHLGIVDSCTIRDDDGVSGTTACTETPSDSCDATLRVCAASTAGNCADTMAACRVEQAPIVRTAGSNIRAMVDNGAPSKITARFPAFTAVSTTLTAPVADATTETIHVEDLTSHPVVPFDAIIAGTETVRVTAVDGTELTVQRGIAGTAGAHPSGATFEHRVYTSDPDEPLEITAKEGDLLEVTIEPPGTLEPLGVLQLEADGVFNDPDDNPDEGNRTQSVTRLVPFGTDIPGVSWFTNDLSVARVGQNSGVVVSPSACGGRALVRARATNSTVTASATFDPNSTADDVACETDDLCDQAELCVERANPLPAGTTCEDDTPPDCTP